MNEKNQPAVENVRVAGKSLVKKKSPYVQISRRYGNELANLFAGLLVVAMAVLFLLVLTYAFEFWPGENFPGYLITTSVILGIGSFLMMMYFIAQAEVQKKDEEKETAYVINKWRISTMNATGIPEDIIAGLESILPKTKNGGENAQLVMKRPFEFDAWIFRLSDLLGEERVIRYEDQLLRHTKTKIKVRVREKQQANV